MKILLTALIMFSVKSFAGQNESMLGLSVGQSFLSKSEDGIDKKGLNYEIKGIYSIDRDFFNYDLGIGYQRNELKGDLNPGDIKIKTNSAFLEADAKYKLNHNYFGLGVKVLGGTDSSFKEVQGTYSPNTEIGLKYQYDALKSEGFNYRLEASVYTTMIDPKNITYQIGLNIGKKETKIISQMEPPLKIEEVSDIKIIIKSARVLFDSAAYKLEDSLKEKLANLAKYLLKNNQLWGRIKISGHTDNRGSYQLNKELSKKRAEEIKSILVLNGVDESKIETVAYSFSVPIESNETEQGRARNRRTEVEFFNVKDREELNKNIVKILE